MGSSIPVPSLEIYLLGSFHVKINGSPVNNRDWQRRSSVKLIKLLALSPERRAHREQIIEHLWANQYSENLTNNLNKAIHGARRALEPGLSRPSDSQFIITENQHVGLTAPDGDVFIDAIEFEKTAERAIKNEAPDDCENALALYRGDLLVEDLYEDWTVSRRERLQLLYRKLVTKTAEIYMRLERFERSVELLKKLSFSDPTDERAHLELMRLYALTGSKYQALKQFEICRKALAEIGFRPDAGTIELKEQIQAGEIRPVKRLAETSKNVGLDQSNHNGDNTAASKVEPEVKRLTHSHGVVHSARFMPDGQNIVCSAAWEENDFEIYKIQRQSLEFVPVGVSRAGLFSVSTAGALAVALNRRFERGYKSIGTLARLNFAGEDLIELLEDIEWAEWHPGKSADSGAPAAERLAVVRSVNGRNQLEYPLGSVVHETGGWISHPRFSPNGDKIAFINHSTLDDDGGEIVVVGLRSGDKKILSGNWISAQGLVWSGTGNEVWFTATREGNSRAIYAVDLRGEERLIYKGTGSSLTIHDLSEGGAALVTFHKTQIKIAAKTALDVKERDLTWHDWSLVRDVSPDGAMILFTEAGESGGNSYAALTRKLDGSQTVRLGEGSALAFSPEARSALVKVGARAPRLAVYSLVGQAERKMLAAPESKTLFYQPWASWFPDGKSILFAANEADCGARLYTQELDGEPVCITPVGEGFEISTPDAISPDGKTAAIIHPDRRVYLYSFESGAQSPLPKLPRNFMPVGWSADGQSLFVRERGRVPVVVFDFNLATGKLRQMFELYPQYSAGVYEILRVLVTPDRQTYAYSFTREFSDLLVIENLA